VRFHGSVLPMAADVKIPLSIGKKLRPRKLHKSETTDEHRPVFICTTSNVRILALSGRILRGSLCLRVFVVSSA
jgi:hypothetical protein